MKTERSFYRYNGINILLLKIRKNNFRVYILFPGQIYWY